MLEQMLPATIYARFSSLEQAEGMSIERQVKKCRKLCDGNGWEVSSDRILLDEGRSAFHSANRLEGGALFDFERRAKAGHFSNGHALVVEHLDRVSRAGYEQLLDFINSLTAAGVTVATVSGNLYPPHQRLAMTDVMKVLIEAEVAREESEKKSDRQLAWWEAKVGKAREGDTTAFTRLVPSWITVDPKDRTMTLREDRAVVVREIFEWCAAGYGAPAIVKFLNDRQEPTWGEYAKTNEAKGRVAGDKRAKGGWQVGQVLRLFDNTAVVGEYQPMKRSRSATMGAAKGDSILDFYPAAIDRDLWSRARRARDGRRQSGGKTWGRQVNLFSGFAICAVCKGRMEYVGTTLKGRERKGTNGSRKPITYIAKEDISYLQCGNARRRHECSNRSRIRYQWLERAVLDNVLSAVLDSSHFAVADRVATLQIELAQLDHLQADRAQRIDRLIDSLSRVPSEAIERSIAALEGEGRAARQERAALVEALDEAKGQVSPEEHQRRIGEVRDLIVSDDPDVRAGARLRLHQSLKDLINVVCSPDKSSIVMIAGDVVALKLDGRGEVVFATDRMRQLEQRARSRNPIIAALGIQELRGVASGVLEDNSRRLSMVKRRRKND